MFGAMPRVPKTKPNTTRGFSNDHLIEYTVILTGTVSTRRISALDAEVKKCGAICFYKDYWYAYGPPEPKIVASFAAGAWKEVVTKHGKQN